MYFHVPEANFNEPPEYLRDLQKIVKDMDLAEIIQTFETIIHDRNHKD